MKQISKLFLTSTLLVISLLTFVGCSKTDSSDNSKETVDNTPTQLTVDNLEQYVSINAYTNNKKSTTNDGNSWLAEYDNSFDTTIEVNPSKEYYFEDVTIELKYYINWFHGKEDYYYTATVKLDYSGRGKVTKSSSIKSTGQKILSYGTDIEKYEISSVSGKVYKSNPNK